MTDLEIAEAKKILSNYPTAPSVPFTPLSMCITLSRNIAKSPAYNEEVLKLAALEAWKDTILKNMQVSGTYDEVNDKVNYTITLMLGREG